VVGATDPFQERRGAASSLQNIAAGAVGRVLPRRSPFDLNYRVACGFVVVGVTQFLASVSDWHCAVPAAEQYDRAVGAAGHVVSVNGVEARDIGAANRNILTGHVVSEH
jgi:hypothetical protein